MSALLPNRGAVILAPERQKYPALQGLLGLESPQSSQAKPPVHSLQSLMSSSPVWLLNVPGGHLYWLLYFVPSGQ